jgi:hypothetical protein
MPMDVFVDKLRHGAPLSRTDQELLFGLAAAMAGPLMGLVGLALIWLGVKLDLHNAAGRALIGLLAPK